VCVQPNEPNFELCWPAHGHAALPCCSAQVCCKPDASDVWVQTQEPSRADKPLPEADDVQTQNFQYTDLPLPNLDKITDRNNPLKPHRTMSEELCMPASESAKGVTSECKPWSSLKV